MSLNTGRTRLVGSLKELHVRWARVRTRWNDPVAKAFEEEHLAPLDAKIRAAVGAMEEMDDVLRRVRRECG